MKNNIATKLHQIAMDLYDFGKIYKAKGIPEIYDINLSLALQLDEEAAVLIQKDPSDPYRLAAYPRSAGWLAYKSGKYVEAKQLAELGLSHKGQVFDYEIQKLEELLAASNKKIKETAPTLAKKEHASSILAVVASANIDEEFLQIRPVGAINYTTIKVAAEDIVQTARLFLGETVEIEVKENEKGERVLTSIRRAA